MFVHPFRMLGEYEDGEEIEVGGKNEAVCMCKLIDLQDKHGRLVYYSEICDDEEMYGECIC